MLIRLLDFAAQIHNIQEMYRSLQKHGVEADYDADSGGDGDECDQTDDDISVDSSAMRVCSASDSSAGTDFSDDDDDCSASGSSTASRVLDQVLLGDNLQLLADTDGIGPILRSSVRRTMYA